MAQPKHKTPRSARGSRRAHQALAPRAAQACPKCNEPKLPHRVCRNCGHYKNLEVLKIED